MLIQQNATPKITIPFDNSGSPVAFFAGLIVNGSGGAASGSLGSPIGPSGLIGFIDYQLGATDASAIGDTIIYVTDGTVIIGYVKIQVVPFNPNDSAGLGLTNLDATVSSRLPTSSYGAPNAATIASVVWNEDLSLHNGAGTSGKALTDAAAGGGGGSDPWDEPLPGAYASGTAGHIVGNLLDAAISTRASASNLATALTDLDVIQARLPAALVSGRMDSSVGAMAANVLTASAINANAFTASKFASSFITTSAFASGAINAAALAADAAQEIADAILDRSAGVETDLTPRQALRVIVAALAGQLAGAGTTTITIRDTQDTLDRITATVDEDGNRTAITLNLS